MRLHEGSPAQHPRVVELPGAEVVVDQNASDAGPHGDGGLAVDPTTALEARHEGVEGVQPGARARASRRGVVC